MEKYIRRKDTFRNYLKEMLYDYKKDILSDLLPASEFARDDMRKNNYLFRLKIINELQEIINAEWI